MLISEDNSLSKYVIKSYSDDQIVINDQSYTSSLIVTPTHIMDWRPRELADLHSEDFSILLELKPEFVLLGTGIIFKTLPEFIRKAFEDRLIIETMTTKAACRSFAVLSSEGRDVAAALIL